MSDPTTQLLEEEEGRVPHVYPDSRGYMTIGVGHLVDARRNAGLDDHVIDLQLQMDIAKAVAGLRRLLSTAALSGLGPCRMAAVVSLDFQLGNTGLDGFHDLLSALERRDYTSAAAAGRDSLLEQQAPARTEREMKMLESGVWVPKS